MDQPRKQSQNAAEDLPSQSKVMESEEEARKEWQWWTEKALQEKAQLPTHWWMTGQQGTILLAHQWRPALVVPGEKARAQKHLGNHSPRHRLSGHASCHRKQTIQNRAVERLAVIDASGAQQPLLVGSAFQGVQALTLEAVTSVW